MCKGYRIKKILWDCDCRPTYHDYDGKTYTDKSEAEAVCKNSSEFLEIYEVKLNKMIGYKIRYVGQEYWANYDNVVYANKLEAEKVMEDAEEQFPNHTFKIYEVDLDNE